MRKAVSFLVLLGLAAMPALAAVETYNDVPVVDVNCSRKVAADPDSHTRACALKCAASGFGIVTKGKQFLKFDAEGKRKDCGRAQSVGQERSSSRGRQRGCARRYVESHLDQTSLISLAIALVHSRPRCAWKKSNARSTFVCSTAAIREAGNNDS